MTIATLSLSALKRAKNSVIGNPTAKRALANDETFIATLIDMINNPPLATGTGESPEDLRIEAAHVIASLSYDSSSALRTLLKYDAPQAFLYAISAFPESEEVSSPQQLKLRAAFTRALRALAVAIAEVVGPSQWGLHTGSTEVRPEAKIALDYLFQVEILDIYLPLLLPPTSSSIAASGSVSLSSSIANSTPVAIAQLLASALRVHSHRASVATWLPPAERAREASGKGRRGWELPGVTLSTATGGLQAGGGWVVRCLVQMLSSKDAKMQEAALDALASLAKENPLVALALNRPPPEREATLSTVLTFCKSRSAELRLAACLCAMQIIRAGLPAYDLGADDAPSLTVMYVLNRFIDAEDEQLWTRTRACFILANLVRDNKELCEMAFQRGSLEKLACLIIDITPTEKTPEWEEDEPESMACLREAALTTVAAISLFNDDIRCAVADTLKLIPPILVSLAHPHVGVRYGACQCVRALSRSVAVLRTNIVDSGLGMAVYRMFMSEGEDRRVTFIASSVICNLVNESSPLRIVVVEEKLLPRLVQLLHSDEQDLRLNALWAIKNLLYHSSLDVKKRVMDAIGWNNLAELLIDGDPGTQEQAFNIMRHLADNTDDVDMVFNELGSETLLGHLSTALESEFDDVVLQAVCVLANLANNPSHQDAILSYPRILAGLKEALTDSKVEVRRPAMSCILELVRANPRSHQAIHEAGLDSTLRHIAEYSGGVSGSPTRRFAVGLHMSMEDEVRDRAREALHWLEHNAEMGV